MGHLWSRRQMIGAGGAVGALGIAGAGTLVSSGAAGAATPPGSVPARPLVAPAEPMRLLDTRATTPFRPAGKLQPGQGVGVTVPSLDGSAVVAAYLNVTITQTVGA